jgi:arylsulfatase A-like enzyme/tetratricopeptide (TPR) repeat protein
MTRLSTDVFPRGILAESATIQAMRFTALAAALLCLAACRGAPAAPPAPAVATSVLIVTIDTLRADRVGIYGARVETPNIDRLAREGAWAPQADVQVPMTRPSHVSLFTGRYPSEHGIRDNISQPLASDVPVLAEAFHQTGHATAAFVSSAVLDRQSGLARGFDVYSDRFENGADRRSGDRTVADAIGWLKAHPGFFAWVHLFEPHAPYQPPEPYASRYAGRPYDGTVAWSDELIGRLTGALRDTGALDSTLVIVTSDHGESLGDHGEDTHGYFVYESTLHVPLVCRGPGVAAGTIVKNVVRTVDLYPTILALAGLPPPAKISGRSLAPALNGATMSDEPSFGESLTPLLHYGWSDLRAVRDGRWKYILAPKPELYDLQNDPGETKNIASTDTTHAAVLRSAIEGRLNQERGASGPSSAQGIPPDVLERLGALGYVGPGHPISSKSSNGAVPKADAVLADPKDTLADYKSLSAAMQDALIAIRTGRYADAVPRLKDVEKRVDSYEVHYYLGRAYAGMQRHREAAREFEAATKRLPGGAEAWRGLGESRVALGDSGHAIPAFEKLVTLAPGDAVARVELGEALRDVARYEDAVRVIREAITLDGRPAQYWFSLGTALAAGGHMAEAERAFNEAISREPNNGLYVYNHGVALYRLGQKDEAAAQIHRAAELGYRPR